jgi:hypothetical protein
MVLFGLAESDVAESSGNCGGVGGAAGQPLGDAEQPGERLLAGGSARRPRQRLDVRISSLTTAVAQELRVPVPHGQQQLEEMPALTVDCVKYVLARMIL